MAEFLIRLTDQGTSPLHIRAGDVVQVAADGWGWGVQESADVWEAIEGNRSTYPSPFAVVRCPEISPREAAIMLQPALDAAGETIMARRYTFDLSTVPPAVIGQLTGAFARADIISRSYDRVTGSYLTDADWQAFAASGAA